jgi:hypothetical protein
VLSHFLAVFVTRCSNSHLDSKANPSASSKERSTINRTKSGRMCLPKEIARPVKSIKMEKFPLADGQSALEFEAEESS